MAVFARVIFGFVQWASRKGFAPLPAAPSSGPFSDSDPKRLARRRTGVRGETFAYWYLRRHGYIIIARNFTVPELKGEIDLVGYDGGVLAFIEVKTRTGHRDAHGLPEDAVTQEKRRHLSRMARQFLFERRLRDSPFRFDVVAIESRPGVRPAVRLHKGAFS
jgi:putative endonuclease